MIHTASAWRGGVTSPHHLASQAGRDVLRAGGTAVEAAVAVAATLAVVYPHMTGIGGDGFWLIAEPDGRVRAIDACGVAGGACRPDLYAGRDEIPWRGPLAVITVPGTVSGWALALAGDEARMPLDRLLESAIDLARHGVAVTTGGAAIAAAKSAELRDLPGGYRGIYEPDGRPLRRGDRLVQSALADTLGRLASRGLDDFYRGSVATDMAADLAALGSPLTNDDLAAHRAATVTPLAAEVSGARLFNLPPPTQGGASLEILALFDRLGVREGEGFAHVHGLVEATKTAFLFRNAHVGDPRFMREDAQQRLAPDAIQARAARIDPVRARPWPVRSEGGDTCWFGAADDRGQVVSCIQSTYFEFGAGLVLPRTGITMQNRGCAFRLHDDGPAALRPGARPFHTLNPALAVFGDGRVMAYGTMGGEGQPQTQAAIFSRYAWFGMPLQEAVTAPRWLLGRTWGEDSTSLKIEDRIAPEVVDQLRRAGHEIEMMPAFTAVMGHAGAIVRHPSGLIEGATDPRSDGGVATW